MVSQNLRCVWIMILVSVGTAAHSFLCLVCSSGCFLVLLISYTPYLQFCSLLMAVLCPFGSSGVGGQYC